MRYPPSLRSYDFLYKCGFFPLAIAIPLQQILSHQHIKWHSHSSPEESTQYTFCYRNAGWMSDMTSRKKDKELATK